MTQACYVVKDRIKDLVEMIVDSCPFYPGKFSAPKTQQFPWAVYTFAPGNMYNQPYISTDSMRIDISHDKFNTLERIVKLIMRDLNRENIQDNSTLYSDALDENIKLHDVIARVHKFDANDFIEGTDYFTATIDILVQYVELPLEPSALTAYVEGA